MISAESSHSIAEHPQAREVTQLFADVFELDDVADDADFFQLGGDSLLATQLMLRIEEQLGVALSPSLLIEASTPLAIAKAVETMRGMSRPLMLRARGGDGPPLYCIHGMDGISMLSGRLAGVLRTANPIFGFRALGLEEGERPLTSVAAMAGRYLEAIEQQGRAATWPYLLLGHCGGSLIAYEMARRLTEQGKTVAGLILIDPEVDHRAPFLHVSGWRLGIELMRLAIRARRFERRIKRFERISFEKRPKMVGTVMDFAVPRYRLKPLNCSTLFVCTRGRTHRLLHPERGFQTFLTNAQFEEIDLRHAKLFREGLEEVARLIGRFLSHVQQTSTGATVHEPMRPLGESRAIPA
jgi:acyl carrier protein/pimeloyl-ACP methyl ester carboxylesterase